mmetsp:Transcript_30485/g.35961  ORF Transcript_30485/g.35961 Transcript_30485/m.35961 type:complete len:531 (+) Transcript_30485:244-1836(+)|eukprot:CAMPEP_0114334194 /NCGR_PEP_ID=MMETSP0101-20121206/4212_1 /TAXON_ID=38822 ORGANISM="Pteridomonas danica, Strain PT" /NCGR_SAMPLE_ID=MMETSP0101 /ASSEMBLY_ACC=CAM_ASM_000211 /LENGTH=530 /DNA_ID=CAMNT_0001465371 /DNA_START=285 /DNA_END=1877 /DNA_ORIENTATION=-
MSSNKLDQITKAAAAILGVKANRIVPSNGNLEEETPKKKRSKTDLLLGQDLFDMIPECFIHFVNEPVLCSASERINSLSAEVSCDRKKNVASESLVCHLQEFFRSLQSITNHDECNDLLNKLSSSKDLVGAVYQMKSGDVDTINKEKFFFESMAVTLKKCEGCLTERVAMLKEGSRLDLLEKWKLILSEKIEESFDLDIKSMSISQLKHLIFIILAKYCDEINPTNMNDITKDNMERRITLFRFIDEVADKHSLSESKFHNIWHFVDVLHAYDWLLVMTHLDKAWGKRDCYVCLVGALCHDLGHLGLTNDYLKNIKHDLYYVYYGSSPLEQLHMSKFFNIISNDKCNIFKDFSPSELIASQKLIFSAILKTDLKEYHGEHVKEMNALYEEHRDDVIVEGQPPSWCLIEKNMHILMAILLHLADISNSVQSLNNYLGWVDSFYEENYAQGDLERAAGNSISYLCDRNSPNVATEQVAFITNIVKPLYSPLFELFPALKPLETNLETNLAYFNKVVKDNEEKKKTQSSTSSE